MTDMPVRTDPPVSEAQRRAMFAAKSGNSNLGIPQSVGREFAEADPGGKLPEHAKDDSRLDACQAALDELTSRMDAVERSDGNSTYSVIYKVTKVGVSRGLKSGERTSDILVRARSPQEALSLARAQFSRMPQYEVVKVIERD